MSNKEKTLNKFIDFKKLSVSTNKTLGIIRHYTEAFINYEEKPLSEFKEEDLTSFINSLREKNLSTGTINTIKVMVKAFIKWFYSDYSSRFRNLNKICQVQKVKSRYPNKDLLSKKDVEKLVQEEKEPLWKAYWLILFYGGFRPEEACLIKWDDITFKDDEAYISLLANKTGKTFEKFIPSNAVFYLKKLRNSSRSVYVFPSKRKHINTTKKSERRIKLDDKPMTRSGVYQHLRDISPSVFGKRINPYLLRHSIATILYNDPERKDSDSAQQLGHSKSMKNDYYHPSKEQIRDNMKRLFIKTEDLPPEKKNELESEVQRLTKLVSHLSKSFDELQEKDELMLNMLDNAGLLRPSKQAVNMR